MKYYSLIVFTLLYNNVTFSQTLKGKVYNLKSVVKDIKVLNKTQNRLTITDKDGNFNIAAKINDTIAFESIFYNPKEVILKQSHFEDINVFEIKKITNKLDEVEIKTALEQPVFKEENYNLDLQNLIKEDIKRNPHLYVPEGAYYGGNLLALIDLVAKLFKNKNKYRPPTYRPLAYHQLDSLFQKSTFFNEQLLKKDLNIPEDQTKLFLDFCSAKGISSELLSDGKKMMLLEQFVINSELFLIILKAHSKETIKKD